jgi:uncharacterized protein DUF4157/LysM domain-containing protein
MRMKAGRPRRPETATSRADEGRMRSVPPTTAPTVRLQRAAGNHGLGRLARSGAIAPKLVVAPASDQYEREADRVAVGVVDGAARSVLPRSGEPSSAAPEAPRIVHDVLRTSGNALDARVREHVEPHFGYAFDAVRVHTDAPSAESARAVGALAYTVGRHIVFDSGQYAPETHTGRRLLAHELTHVVQQNGAAMTPDGSGAMVQRYEAGEHARFADTSAELKELVLAKAFTREVKPGETIRGIASKFSVTVERLEELNHKKLRVWPAADGSRKSVRGFNTGAIITIPAAVNAATADALKGGELSFVVNGITVPYSDGMAMADLFGSREDMLKAPAAELTELIKLIDSERSGTWVDIAVWQAKTGGRFLKLALENEQHFAPPDPSMVKSSGISAVDHKAQWEKHHREALGLSQAGNKDDALEVNAFGDHFLTDAFAGGHLFSKRDAMEQLKSGLPLTSTGDFTADATAFFDDVAHQAFKGSLATDFSQYEPVNIPAKAKFFRPNIDTAEMFSALLQEVHKDRPDVMASVVAKAVHDTINKFPGGIPVANAKGDKWNLSGDKTLALSEDSKRIGRKAVARSQLNVLEAFKVNRGLDLPALFKSVWDYVPRATAAGQATIKAEVASGTDPKSPTLRAAVAALITDNYPLLLKELVALKKLRKA